MTDTYGHTLNSGEKYRESIYKRTIEEVKQKYVPVDQQRYSYPG